MIASDFNDIVSRRLAFCTETLSTKANEYATADRLHNFRVAAALQGCTPERALLGMWAKHIVSVVDLVRKIDEGGLPPELLVEEKVTDTINYALLLEALIEERRRP